MSNHSSYSISRIFLLLTPFPHKSGISNCVKHMEVSGGLIFSLVYWLRPSFTPQAPKAQCEQGRQKYKDLYENPDKKLKKIIICIVTLFNQGSPFSYEAGIHRGPGK